MHLNKNFVICRCLFKKKKRKYKNMMSLLFSSQGMVKRAHAHTHTNTHTCTHIKNSQLAKTMTGGSMTFKVTALLAKFHVISNLSLTLLLPPPPPPPHALYICGIHYSGSIITTSIDSCYTNTIIQV